MAVAPSRASVTLLLLLLLLLPWDAGSMDSGGGDNPELPGADSEFTGHSSPSSSAFPDRPASNSDTAPSSGASWDGSGTIGTSPTPSFTMLSQGPGWLSPSGTDTMGLAPTPSSSWAHHYLNDGPCSAVCTEEVMAGCTDCEVFCAEDIWSSDCRSCAEMKPGCTACLDCESQHLTPDMSAGEPDQNAIGSPGPSSMTMTAEQNWDEPPLSGSETTGLTPTSTAQSNVADCTIAAPCKILALHGGGSSANSMEARMAGLAESLGAAYTFVYASIGGPTDGETWWDDPSGGKGQPTTDPDHASAMVAALNTIRTNHGPFWGLIGYSQGGAAVPVYLSNVPAGTFQAAAMFAGYLTTTHNGLLDRVNDEAPFGDIPALIWLSTADSIIAPGLSRDLWPKFTNPTTLEDTSGAGHVVPTSSNSPSTFSSVVMWFQNTASVNSSWGDHNPMPGSSWGGGNTAYSGSMPGDNARNEMKFCTQDNTPVYARVSRLFFFFCLPCGIDFSSLSRFFLFFLLLLTTTISYHHHHQQQQQLSVFRTVPDRPCNVRTLPRRLHLRKAGLMSRILVGCRLRVTHGCLRGRQILHASP